jgi:PDZ domain-containing secreted protein
MVVPGPLGWDPPLPHKNNRNHSWLAGAASVVVVAVVALIFASFISLPYDVIAPGDTRRVNDLIAAKNVKTYPAKGQFMYTTVSVREHVNVLEMVRRRRSAARSRRSSTSSSTET